MGEYIYNQTRIPRHQWRYGLRSSAATGCGWIAVYNALKQMGYRAEPTALIRYFERQLPLIHGNFGTWIPGPALYFRRWGFPVKLSFRPGHFDDLARQGGVCVLFYRWRRGWRFGAHFITVVHTPDGFVGYNVYSNSEGPEDLGPSLELWIREKGYFLPALTIIHKKWK